MPGGNYERLARELRTAGLEPTTPCLLVSQASTAQQTIQRMDLAALAAVQAAPAPALLLVGEVTREEAVDATRAYRAGTWLADQSAKKELAI
jgi:siroheme synthase